MLTTLLALTLTSPALAVDVSEKIINGSDATPDEYPQAGALLVEAGGYRLFVCSSTLIAPDVVMTAAHCIDPESLQGSGYPVTADSLFVWTRESDVSRFDGYGNDDWPDDAHFSQATVFHSSWSISQLGIGLNLNYDIGLVFLDEPVLETAFAYLPTAEESEQLVEGIDVTVVGWGQQQQGGQLIGVKQQGLSPVGVTESFEFHVGPDTSDVRKCHGDSGGPSFQIIETETIDDMRVVGVTSHAYDSSDCNQTGGVDTRVDYYLDWIEGEMTSRCDDGSRVWCEEPGIPLAPVYEEGEDPWAIPADLVSDVALSGCSVAPAGGGAGALVVLAMVGWRRRRS